jgi:hypothetical protein
LTICKVRKCRGLTLEFRTLVPHEMSPGPSKVVSQVLHSPFDSELTCFTARSRWGRRRAVIQDVITEMGPGNGVDNLSNSFPDLREESFT